VSGWPCVGLGSGLGSVGDVGGWRDNMCESVCRVLGLRCRRLGLRGACLGGFFSSDCGQGYRRWSWCGGVAGGL